MEETREGENNIFRPQLFRRSRFGNTVSSLPDLRFSVAYSDKIIRYNAFSIKAFLILN